jgi:hypothetical protein
MWVWLKSERNIQTHLSWDFLHICYIHTVLGRLVKVHRTFFSALAPSKRSTISGKDRDSCLFSSKCIRKCERKKAIKIKT